MFSFDSDLSDFPFSSVSACPSLAGSPVVARRDSILKHSGSVKNTDRRVSIKQNQPIVLEYLSEKRPSLQSQIGNALQSSALGKSNARPASLVLTKGERPTFKLIRTPSIDQDQDDANISEAVANQLNANRNPHRPAIPNDDDDESAPLVQSDKDYTKITSSNSNHS